MNDDEKTPVDLVVEAMQRVLLAQGLLDQDIQELAQAVITLALRAKGDHD